MTTSVLDELTIRIPNKLVTTKSGYISGTEMATFKVAVDLRATHPTEQAQTNSIPIEIEPLSTGSPQPRS